MQCYERIILHHLTTIKAANPSSHVSESDKKYLHEIFACLVRTFGTEDTEWFCATEAVFNTLFNIKTKNAPEYAKKMI